MQTPQCIQTYLQTLNSTKICSESELGRSFLTNGFCCCPSSRCKFFFLLLLSTRNGMDLLLEQTRKWCRAKLSATNLSCNWKKNKISLLLLFFFSQNFGHEFFWPYFCLHWIWKKVSGWFKGLLLLLCCCHLTALKVVKKYRANEEPS